jgi:hypothetical protein
MSENQSSGESGSRAGALVVGAILVVLGLAFLAGQILNNLFHIDAMSLIWPLFILVPGAVLFALGLFTTARGGEALTIVGGIVGTTGLLLAYQNLSGHWTSWAYAWALIAPTSVGASMAIHGALHRRPDLIRGGKVTALVGLAIFVVGFAFFEMLLNISGWGLGPIGFGVILVGAGIVILVAGLLGNRRTA